MNPFFKLILKYENKSEITIHPCPVKSLIIKIYCLKNANMNINIEVNITFQFFLKSQNLIETEPRFCPKPILRVEGFQANSNDFITPSLLFL